MWLLNYVMSNHTNSNHKIKLVDKAELKEKMIKFGFKTPDMTVTEFVEDELTTIEVEVNK